MKKITFILVVVFLFVGIGAAWYLTMVKLQLQYHPDYTSGCNYSEAINCDTVQTSEQSEIFGIPIALMGIATYVVMIFLAVLAVTGRQYRQKALSALFCIGLATCGYSVYLAIISIFVIKAVCTYCILMYAVNFAVTIAAFLSFPRPFHSLCNTATFFAPFTSWLVPAGIILSFLVSFGTAYALYAGIRSGMIADYIETAESRANQPPAPVPATSRKPAIATAETKIVPAQTGSGLSFMQFPVTAADHVKGPEDAPVTIVQFADFKCSFCRAFFREIAPLENKYKSRVRWVFKHFPLDQECNPRFRTAHPDACKCSRAAICASEQGKFWQAHDYLFGKTSGDIDKDLAHMVTTLGLDQDRFNECLASRRPDDKIAADVRDGYKAGFTGTPRTYINGYLVAGSVGIEIMDYYIQKALDRASDTSAAMTVPVAPSTRTPESIPLKTTQKPFYIDTFEAAIDQQGRAVSLPGVLPAYASWNMAKQACEKAGKRLCTEAEWVTACTGVPAVDNNGNGLFSDDDIEGWMYPYGAYYMGGRCHDSDSKETGKIGPTGTYPGCISAQGVYDLTGNLSEWAVSAMGTPVLLGGHFYLGRKASCAFAINGLGPGVRNEVTGFRCCSDGPAPPRHTAPRDVDNIPLGGRVGMPVMDFSFTDPDGRKVTKQTISQGITVVTLCRPNSVSDKLELQSLQRLREEFEPRGIRFMVIIVDRNIGNSKAVIDSLPFKGPIHVDTDQISMGVFSTRKLPSTYVVDGKGILRLAVPGGMHGTFDTFRDSLMNISGRSLAGGLFDLLPETKNGASDGPSKELTVLAKKLTS